MGYCIVVLLYCFFLLCLMREWELHTLAQWMKLPPRTPSHLVLSPQDNASKLLLALMESRHDSENAERILFNLRPRELVRHLGKIFAFNTNPTSSVAGTTNANLSSVNIPAQMEVIKKAYHQESECEGVEVSPREVGHNIYILAQQVGSVCSSCKDPTLFLLGK